MDHFALRTTGLAGVIEKLEATGTRYRIRYLPEVDLSQVFCRDPAGIGVEINFCKETLEGEADKHVLNPHLPRR
ncbi:MAG: hypothetical protein WBS20_13190 [Lysobacterales bacterium]